MLDDAVDIREALRETQDSAAHSTKSDNEETRDEPDTRDLGR